MGTVGLTTLDRIIFKNRKMIRKIDFWIHVLSCSVILFATFVQAGSVKEQSRGKNYWIWANKHWFHCPSWNSDGYFGHDICSWRCPIHRRQRKRKFGIVDKRQEFIENCNINPHLKPACIR